MAGNMKAVLKKLDQQMEVLNDIKTKVAVMDNTLVSMKEDQTEQKKVSADHEVRIKGVENFNLTLKARLTLITAGVATFFSIAGSWIWKKIGIN